MIQRFSRLLFLPIYCSIFAVSAQSAPLYDEAMGPCEQRMTDTDAGRNPLRSCSENSTCPDHITIDPATVEPADLEVDGWFVFVGGGKVYKSPLKNYNKEQLGSFSDAVDLCISEDGEWILVETENGAHLTKPDGSRSTDLGIDYQKGGACFYKKSPKNTFEIAYMTTGSDIYSVTIDTSSESPTVVPGSRRKIASGMETGYGTEFDVAGDIIVKRATVKTTIGDFYVNKTTRAGVLFTIPDGGIGTATKSTAHKTSAAWNCGITISPSGNFWTANYGRNYADCLPENHKGFITLPVRRSTDSETSIYEWIYESGENGGRVFWCPEIWDGRNLRNGTWKNQEFHYHSYANTDEFTICVHQSAPPYNCWLVNHTTGAWTPLMNENVSDLKHPDVFLTTETAIKRRLEPSGRIGYREIESRSTRLNQWMNILGRTDDGGGLDSKASGVYFRDRRKAVKAHSYKR